MTGTTLVSHPDAHPAAKLEFGEAVDREIVDVVVHTVIAELAVTDTAPEYSNVGTNH